MSEAQRWESYRGDQASARTAHEVGYRLGKSESDDLVIIAGDILIDLECGVILEGSRDDLRKSRELQIKLRAAIAKAKHQDGA